jgi:hypothetical protein
MRTTHVNHPSSITVPSEYIPESFNPIACSAFSCILSVHHDLIVFVVVVLILVFVVRDDLREDSGRSGLLAVVPHTGLLLRGLQYLRVLSCVVAFNGESAGGIVFLEYYVFNRKAVPRWTECNVIET